MSNTPENELRSLPKVLIVDDRQFDRILYKEFLNPSNYEFYELEDGDQVLGFLNETVPDAIILDWQMPRMDGLDVLKQLKNNRRYSHIPIIVITGQESIDVLEQAFDYGSYDFLIKPVNRKELVVRIQQLLRVNEKYKLLNKENLALEDLSNLLKSKNDHLKFQQENSNDSESLELIKLKKLINQIELQLKEIVENQRSKENQGEVTKKISALVKNIQKNKSGVAENSGLKYNTIFNKKLLSVNPSLTNLDIQHCNFLRNNMSNTEIAEVLFVETKTLQTKRYRLKKKLGLDKKVSLRKYLLDL